MYKVLLLSLDNIQDFTVKLQHSLQETYPNIQISWQYITNNHEAALAVSDFVTYINSQQANYINLPNVRHKIICNYEISPVWLTKSIPENLSTGTTETISEVSSKNLENLEKFSESSTKNNGGETDYYALPLADTNKLVSILEYYRKGFYEEPEEAAKEILELFPSTLNDLIEYKNMPFWRGEIFKADYGLEGRMAKNKDVEKAEIRELNKIVYYANRRLKQLVKA